MEGFLEQKEAGQVDIPPVQQLKQSIREAEAVSGIETFGMRRDQARFLNLPFYQTGKVRKDPIGPRDVKITLDLLEEHRPEYIFVAGDLSDPHGTHRMCLEAVHRALEHYSGETPGDLVLPRRLAGVVGGGSGRAGADVRGGAAAQDPGDLQAPEPEGPGAIPRRRTTASSGSGWRSGTPAPPASWTAWACRSTSRWRRTWCARNGKPLKTEILSTAELAAPPRRRRVTDHPGVVVENLAN